MKFLVWDIGIGFDHAKRLAEDGHSVYYYIDASDEFTTFEKFIQGEGHKNIIKVMDPGEALLAGVDCIMFTDVGNGALADYFRKQGIPVFGASYDGETLEQDRAAAHVLLGRLGILTPPYRTVAGFPGVLEWFKKNLKDGKRYFLKLPIFRGNMETAMVTSLEEADIIIRGSGMMSKLGPFGDNFEFIIEDGVKGVEIGIDAFWNGEKLLEPQFFTFEIASDLNVGRWVKTNETPWGPLLEKITPYLVETDYRGGFSFEGIWDGKNIYVLDCTCRFPYPGSMIFSRLLPNYSKFIYAVASKQDYELKPNKRYGATIGLYSDRSKEDWNILTAPSGAGKVGLRSSVRWGSNLYVSPGEDFCAAVTSEADKWQDLEKDLRGKHKKLYTVDGETIDESAFTTLVNEYIKPCKDYGFVF